MCTLRNVEFPTAMRKSYATLNCECEEQRTMNTSGFKKQLAAAGAVFKEGGKHTKVYLNGRQCTLPRHKEIPDQLAKVILRQLGL